MLEIAKYISFRGRVQGVGFRYTASRIAKRYELTGFVKNMPDGSVEMLAQGVIEDVEACIEDICESFNGYIRDKKIAELPIDTRLKEFEITFL